MCVTTPTNYGDPGHTWEPFEAYLKGSGLYLWFRDLELLKAENVRLKADCDELIEALDHSQGNLEDEFGSRDEEYMALIERVKSHRAHNAGQGAIVL